MLASGSESIGFAHMYDLDERCDIQRALNLAPELRPVMESERFVAPTRNDDGGLERVPTLN